MTSLERAIAAMLRETNTTPYPVSDAIRLAETPQGAALAALVEAAVAWKRAAFGDLQPSLRALGEAVERWEEAAHD